MRQKKREFQLKMHLELFKAIVKMSVGNDRSDINQNSFCHAGENKTVKLIKHHFHIESNSLQ